MFIKITFYTNKKNEVICSDPDAAHEICSILDKNTSIRQWKTDLLLEEFPWYQEGIYKNLKHNFKDWNYS
jgi:hypothetical protein